MLSEKEMKNLHQPSARRRFFLFLRHSFLWFAAGVGLLWLSSFFLIASVAERKIEGLCGGAAYVQSGRLRLLGSAVKLKGVMIATQADRLVQSPFFQADEIELKFSLWRLLRGQFMIHSISLNGMYLSADYFVPDDEWNIPEFHFGKSSSSHETLPFIEVHNGTVQFRRIEPDKTPVLITVGLNGKIAADTKTGQYSFKLEADDRFGFHGSVLEGLFKASTQTAAGNLSMNGRIRMGGQRVLDNAWDLQDIRFDCTFDSQQIILNRCDFSLGQGKARLTGRLAETADGQPIADLDVDLTQFELADADQPNALVYSRLITDFAEDPVSGFLKRYHPTGTGDVQLSIRNFSGSLAEADLTGRVVCRDVSVCYDQFPYRIDHLAGQIELAGHHLHIQKLSGKHRPGGDQEDVDLAIKADILNLGGDREMDIAITIPNMLFDDDLYGALNDSVKKVWYSFTPAGRAGIQYRYQKKPGIQSVKSLTLEMKQASVTYEHFPYLLKNITGTVRVEPDEIVLDQLAAHYDDDRRVRLNGRVLRLAGERPEFEIHVDAENVPLDQEFIHAMPVQQRVILKKFEIQKVDRVEVEVRRNRGDERPLDFTAAVHVDGQSLVYQDCNVPMTDVTLEAVITPDRVNLQSFQAAVDGGTVRMSGFLTPKGIDPNHPGVCLDLDIRQFDLNDVFWRAAGVRADTLLGDFRMDGRVGVSGHLALNAVGPACDQMALKIDCSDNSLLLAGAELARANGELNVVDRQLTFSGFQLAGIQLASLPRSWLSSRPAILALYDRLTPRGTMTLGIREGVIVYRGNRLETVRLGGGLKLEQTACGHNQVLHELFGQADWQFDYTAARGASQAIVTYDFDHFLWDHYQVSDLQGQFMYDSASGHFETRQFTAQLYGGRLVGDFEANFSAAEASPYQASLSLEGANVKDLLSAEFQEAEKNIFKGMASGSLHVQGDLRQLSGGRGKFTARVQELKLGRQSVMGKVLTAMQLKVPSDFAFDEIRAEGALDGVDLTIDSLRLIGKPMAFWGSGTMNLTTNHMALSMVAFNPLMGDAQMILNRLARGIGQAIWKIEMTGSVTDPSIQTVYFSVLKQPLDIFKKQQEPTE